MDAVVAPVDHNKLEPVAVNTELPHPSTPETVGDEGIALGAAVTVAGALVQPPTICVTVYEPAVETVIVAVVAPVDQRRLVPVAVSTELPQLFVAVTTGAEGADGSAIEPESVFDAHPSLNTIEYVPAANPEIVYGNVTAVALPDAVPDQDIFPVPVPFIVNEPSVAPQTVGLTDAPIEIVGETNGEAVPEAGALVQPPTVCVTVYVPADVTVIDEVVAPVDHNQFDPLASNTLFPQLFITVTTGADGVAIGFAATVEGALVQPPTV